MVEIVNLTKIKIPRKFIETSLDRTFKKLKIKKNLSVVFVSSRKIKELNRRYLKKDRVTDVLSFSGQENYLGETVICCSQAKKQAKQQKHSFKKEIFILLFHSLLHLLGFNHQSEEEEKEEKIKTEKKV